MSIKVFNAPSYFSLSFSFFQPLSVSSSLTLSLAWRHTPPRPHHTHTLSLSHACSLTVGMPYRLSYSNFPIRYRTIDHTINSVPYGVATISRLLKIIGLLYQRALYKRDL